MNGGHIDECSKPQTLSFHSLYVPKVTKIEIDFILRG